MLGKNKMALNTGEITTVALSWTGLLGSMLELMNSMVGLVSIIVIVATYFRAGKLKKNREQREIRKAVRDEERLRMQSEQHQRVMDLGKDNK